MRSLGLLLVLVLICSCGTITDLDDNGLRIMGGVQRDWRQISAPAPMDRVLIPFYVIDLPMSLGMDVLLLPISVALRLNEDEEGQRAKDKQILP